MKKTFIILAITCLVGCVAPHREAHQSASEPKPVSSAEIEDWGKIKITVLEYMITNLLDKSASPPNPLQVQLPENLFNVLETKLPKYHLERFEEHEKIPKKIHSVMLAVFVKRMEKSEAKAYGGFIGTTGAVTYLFELKKDPTWKIDQVRQHLISDRFQ